MSAGGWSRQMELPTSLPSALEGGGHPSAQEAGPAVQLGMAPLLWSHVGTACALRVFS